MAAAHGQVTGNLCMSADIVDIEAARELVQRTAILLDDAKFDDWIGLFDSGGTY